jgi:hypothetical protein
MINPLKVASAGYLKRTTKAVLVIAVAGYLNFGGGPAPPHGGSGGGDISSINYNQHQNEETQRREILDRVLKDDEDWENIMAAFIKIIE